MNCKLHHHIADLLTNDDARSVSYEKEKQLARAQGTAIKLIDLDEIFERLCCDIFDWMAAVRALSEGELLSSMLSAAEPFLCSLRGSSVCSGQPVLHPARLHVKQGPLHPGGRRPRQGCARSHS